MNNKIALGGLGVGSTVILLTIAGCAHLPDATVNYYLPTSTVGFTVVRTIGCNDKNQIFIASAATPIITHVADRSAAKPIPLKKLRGTFSDTDVKVDFYDDGRLKGLNGSSTGEGEAILKTVITILGAAYAFDGNTQFPTECKAINTVGGGKPLALTYHIDNVKLTQTDAKGQPILDDHKRPVLYQSDQEIRPDPISDVIVHQNKLASVVGKVCVHVLNEIEFPTPRAAYTRQPQDILLDLREPAWLKIEILAGGTQTCGENWIWKQSVPVAQLGTNYQLPLPKPTIFGKRSFVAAFTESGSLQSVQFVANAGAGQALNVMNAAETAAKPQSTAQKANDLKAEADLIAQQQRLTACLAKPADCK